VAVSRIEIGSVLCGGYRFKNTDPISLPLRARIKPGGEQTARYTTDECLSVHR